MHKNINNCELCGSDSIKVDFFLPSFKGLNNDFISKCNSCNFIFKARPYANQINLSQGDYYSSKKIGSIVNNRFKKHFTKRSKQHYKYIKKFISNQPKTALDIGCGAGFFIKELIVNNWDAIGLEPDPIMYDYALENSLNVKKVTFTDFNPNKKFGLIYLSHVLDDMPYINKTIKKINSLLTSGGLLFIEVPNYSWNYRLNFTKEEDIIIGKYFFSNQTLKSVVINNGFEMINQFSFESIHTNTTLQKITSPFKLLSKLKPSIMKSYLRGIYKKI